MATRAAFRAFDRLPLSRWILERRLRRAGSDIFNDPASAFARSYARAGGTAHEYSFSWMENDSPLGAGHAIDLLSLFGPGKSGRACSALGLAPEEVLKAGVPIRAVWTGFAKDGTIARSEIEGMLSIWVHEADGHPERTRANRSA